MISIFCSVIIYTQIRDLFLEKVSDEGLSKTRVKYIFYITKINLNSGCYILEHLKSIFKNVEIIEY